MKKIKAIKGGGQQDTGTHPSVPRLAFTAAELAASLGYENVVTVHRLVKRGLLNPSRATRNFIFPAWEVDRFLRANTKAA